MAAAPKVPHDPSFSDIDRSGLGVMRPPGIL